MKNERTLVISDIHGCFDEFMELLSKCNYNPKIDKLIISGDLIDRGKKSKELLDAVISLKKEHDIVVLGGNHEEMFLEWLEKPHDRNHRYTKNGGWRTVESLCKPYKVFGKSSKTKLTILKHYREHLEFIKSLPFYYEDDKHIYVHAGVDLKISDWKNSEAKDFKWIREEFFNEKNTTGKFIVFGHTPTEFLNEDAKQDVWFSEDGKIGIDGGISMGGMLHCLIIEGERHSVVSVTAE